MEKLKTVLAVILFGMMVTACDSSTNQFTSTHVKDLVQSDVFEVLPQSDMDILVYSDATEIEGEYFELATVEIKDSKLDHSSEKVVDMLKEEAKKLGANGVLILEQTENEDGRNVTKEVKAITVYALDREPVLNTLVSL